MREFKNLKIAVAGTGYVGLSIATLLSQHHKVTAVDIIPEKVELINNKNETNSYCNTRYGKWRWAEKPAVFFKMLGKFRKSRAISD